MTKNIEDLVDISLYVNISKIDRYCFSHCLNSEPTIAKCLQEIDNNYNETESIKRLKKVFDTSSVKSFLYEIAKSIVNLNSDNERKYFKERELEDIFIDLLDSVIVDTGTFTGIVIYNGNVFVRCDKFE
jgi:hypothetical protein